MMLGWIPFRAQTLADTFSMWTKLFFPSEYLWLGMRENVYLITALLTISIIITYIAQTRLLPLLRTRPLIALVSETMVFTVVIGLVFVFLRPINQFIYFQF